MGTSSNISKYTRIGFDEEGGSIGFQGKVSEVDRHKLPARKQSIPSFYQLNKHSM